MKPNSSLKKPTFSSIESTPLQKGWNIACCSTTISSMSFHKELSFTNGGIF